MAARTTRTSPDAAHSSTPRSRSREVASTIGFAAALGLAIAGIFAARGDDFLLSWLVATLYGTSIGVPASLLMPRLKGRLGTMRELSQWFVYGGVMLAIIAFGSALTGLVMVALQLVPLPAFWDSYKFGFVISLIISVPASVGAATYARLAARVHASEAAAARSEAAAAASEAAATEARLASLESRVRPHFLFNALNSAIALIPEDPTRAENVLERLAALLRFSLDRHQQQLVTLGEELRVVVDYLEIERVRFGDRLRYTLDVPSELEGRRVPAFSLQTLVENSVKYAVATRADGGEITIAARDRADRLQLAVVDDGPGFAGTRANRSGADATHTDDHPRGHGLDTLRGRLDALYGRDARLIAPAPTDRGARVEVEVPLMKSEGTQEHRG